MKFGIRTPSPKRSISARTTGRLKRSIKKAANPFYGKANMGYINNPKKAIYNNIYNKATIGVDDLLTKPNTRRKTTADQTLRAQPSANYAYSAKTYKGTGVFLVVVACILALAGLFTLPVGLVFIGLAVLLFFIGRKYISISNYKKDAQEDNEADED